MSGLGGLNSSRNGVVLGAEIMIRTACYSAPIRHTAAERRKYA